MTPIPMTSSSVTQSDAGAAKHQRLHKAAHQVEAMMLGEMLKPLTQAGEDALNGDNSKSVSGPLQSFGMEAVAGALSNSNALGFAQQIEHALLGHTSATKGSSVAPIVPSQQCTKVSEKP